MPVYEYRCNDCNRKVTVYIRGFTETPDVVCKDCGSTNLSRLMSRVVVHKTYMDVYEDILTDRELVSGMMNNDPRAMAKWSQKMEGAAGEDITPEYREMMGRMEAGEPWQNVMGEMQNQYMEGLGDDDSGSDED
jgi:putative FmdB family regulatory protein